jgi:hypothetical protein
MEESRFCASWETYPTIPCCAIFKHCDWMICICVLVLFDWFRGKAICESRYGKFPTPTKSTPDLATTCHTPMAYVRLQLFS